MSNEQDFDDVQKTLTDWTYQIVEVDINRKSRCRMLFYRWEISKKIMN
jgi:hypothetical protein